MDPAKDSIEIWKSLSYDASAGYNCRDGTPQEDDDCIPAEIAIGQRSRSVDFENWAQKEMGFHSKQDSEETDRRFSDSHVVNLQPDKDNDVINGRCFSFASVAVKDFGKAAKCKNIFQNSN